MGRLRGVLWLAAGLLIALLAGFIAYQSLTNATESQAEAGGGRGPTIDVVVAQRAVPIRTQLGAEDVELIAMPVEFAPQNALRELGEAIGQVTTIDLYPGEILGSERLFDPNVIARNGRVALFMAEDEVLMAIPAQDLLSQVKVLKAGDRIDLLFSLDVPTERLPGQGNDTDDEQATLNLLQNVMIVGLLHKSDEPVNEASVPNMSNGDQRVNESPSSPDAILLTLPPQDALVVKYAIDAGGIMEVVLRAPDADQVYEIDPVDVDYLINRYDIPAAVGQ